ncbi:4-(cytidine 5'-diphospho)-2-C-methyl-D-erythritol kinase [Colwellia psychrerythraea]|uniref:4-diphosphocytidyl-2-C-methyl-D-erythritol kinase n=1 Tax=Colwellia psychrerythraea TaxID=28229 RepID=A0A099L211_COLPS|nr:4-(cytidine 5'-diphospho)-2-C-methyl-D-erythritol kinase [Colwellia psychrerythraea]KGJ96147.1 4-diphosphocytidyl-2-C-methyl-D-erythritol kinase [Colwellia psychrerythraea]
MTCTVPPNSFINKSIEFPSPAKINLFLHIVGRRDDGYHNLETLFQFIDYSDTLTLMVTETSSIELLTPIAGVNNADNLIIKAAQLLKNKSKTPLGVRISINKILPMGGGLGGGSSNAATILVALNTLWQCQLSLSELATLGLSLGADVPIFIHGFSAFAQGVGEKLTAIEPHEPWYLITKPDCSISTQQVFTAEDLPRNTSRLPPSALETNDFINDNFQNDCQILVIKQYPEVAKLLAWLVEYAPSRMTGTGACVFSRFSSQQEARSLQEKLPQGISSFVAQGLNKSPLCSVIAKLSLSV